MILLMTNSSKESWQEMAVVGRVARAHGKRGEVIVNAETDFPEQRFQGGSVVFLDQDGTPKAFRIRQMRLQTGRPILAFDGIEKIDQAESLAGLELRVPVSTLPDLPPDTYYEHELVDCRVRTIVGSEIGTVVAVRRSAGANRLVLRSIVGEGEIEIPLVESICVKVEPWHKTIVVDPPAGLLELNER